MKTHRILLVLLLSLTLLAATTQASARPADLQSITDTPTVTPTAPPNAATQLANLNATRQAGKSRKHEIFNGAVSAVDPASMTLSLRDGTSVSIGLSLSTLLRTPGLNDSRPTRLRVGDNVMVLAVRDQNGNLLARFILIIPNQPSKVHRVGIVTEYTAGVSITIQEEDGKTYTFAISGRTVILPADRAGTLGVGARVTIIAPRDGVMAHGIVVQSAAP
jgi:hypothetical protein